MTKLVNRAKMTTASTGTGSPITLGSAVDGYQTFAAAGVANSDVVRYVIEDGNNWEIGTGIYTSTGTTLSRTVSESSNAGSAISLSGNAVVFVAAAAEEILQEADLTAGTGISITNTTISHADTSGQSSIDNSGSTVIQDVTLDTYGHVTGLGSATLTASTVGAAALAGSASQAFSASTLNATTVDLGDWTITESAGVLYFAYQSTNKMKMDSSGNLTVTGNVTAYGTV